MQIVCFAIGFFFPLWFVPSSDGPGAIVVLRYHHLEQRLQFHCVQSVNLRGGKLHYLALSI